MASHEQGFIRKYVFSTDHKVIGIQYALTSLTFLFIGLMLMLMMRWQLANPGQPVPVVGGALESLLGRSPPTSTIRSVRCTAPL
jgi:cytochrome c oxidase subunit I